MFSSICLVLLLIFKVEKIHVSIEHLFVMTREKRISEDRNLTEQQLVA